MWKENLRKETYIYGKRTTNETYINGERSPTKETYTRDLHMWKENLRKETYTYGKRLTNWQIMRSPKTKASTRKETYK